jgi:hypothetical protein
MAALSTAEDELVGLDEDVVAVIVKLGCAIRGPRNGFAKSLEPAGGGVESDSPSLSFD